jgi:hypothetical protein
VCFNYLNRKITNRNGEQMSVKLGHQIKQAPRVRSLFAAIVVFAYAFGKITHAEEQRMTPPATPNSITPPAGNAAFFVGHAVGTQGYVCLPLNPDTCEVGDATIEAL